MASLREAQQRYARHYLALAERAEPELRGAEQAAWLERLELEHDNLRAVLRWAQERGEQQMGLQLAGAVLLFWMVRGYVSEGRNWLEGLLRHARVPEAPDVAPAVRAKALSVVGALAYRQGDLARATALHEESLALRRELGDWGGIAASLNNLGLVAQEQGNYARATGLYEESLALHRELGDRQTIAISLNNLANVVDEQGDYARATGLHEESLALCRDLGDTWGIASSLHNLANVARDQGEYKRATVLYEESLALCRELGDTWGIAGSLHSLGYVACEEGDYTRATALHEESLALRWELGDTRGIAEGLEGLASVACAPGVASEALERAARLASAAAAVRAAIGVPLVPNERAAYDHAVATTRTALGEAAFAAAWDDGQRLALEQAIALALGEPSPA